MTDHAALLLYYVLMLPPLIFSLTLHEYAHARVAYYFGDPTAKAMGRLTLNPLKHVDWFGLLLLIIVKFGWAKPVPVNPRYFQNPRRDMLWVGLAGPAMNLSLAFASAMILRVIGPSEGIVPAMLWYFMEVNTILAIFNLLPIPPLDGSRVLAGLLPEAAAAKLDHLERYAMFLIAGLFLYIQFVDAGMIRAIVRPFRHFLEVIAGG